MTAIKTNFYVVGEYLPEGEFYLLGGEGQTLADAKRAIWWQGQGQADPHTHWHICTPTNETEVLRDINTKTTLRLSGRGARTVEAYARQIAAIWPTATTEDNRFPLTSGLDSAVKKLGL